MIYIASNRELNENSPLGFGYKPNGKGIEELRIATAKKVRGIWQVNPHKEASSMDVDTSMERKPSFKLFRKLQKSMMDNDRNCVFLIHGYNVNFVSALETAKRVKDLYNVEVILFSWPSLGAGEGEKHLGKEFVGTINYKRDKRTAIRSVPALDKVFFALGSYFDYTQKQGIACGQSFNLLAHSMGNYLLKHLMNSSVYSGDTLLFDNVVLCAADVNNQDHEKFVAKIPHRRRVYVTINENDFALKWSRRKLGEQQKARLGHYTRNLNSNIAVYLDFTGANHVRKSHGYFSDEAAENNEQIHSLFNELFNGERGERLLVGYDPDKRIYSV